MKCFRNESKIVCFLKQKYFNLQTKVKVFPKRKYYFLKTKMFLLRTLRNETVFEIFLFLKLFLFFFSKKCQKQIFLRVARIGHHTVVCL